MDPYYEVVYNGNKVVEGPKAFGMNKDPIWNDFTTVNHVVELDSINSGDIEVNFVNDGDIICGLAFTVPELIATRNAIKWYDSQRKGKTSGQFKMQVVYDGPREEQKMDEKKPISSSDPIATGMPVQ